MQYYDVRFNYNIESHCCKADESFIDYYIDSEKGKFTIYFDNALYQVP